MLSEMMMLYNGSNNGKLWLSIRDAAALVGFSDEEAASSALKALVAHGLLAIVTPGHFTMKQRHATSYRLYLLPNPKTRKPIGDIKHSRQHARKAAVLGDLRIHDLRHNAASFMISAGIDLFAVGRFWATPTMRPRCATAISPTTR